MVPETVYELPDTFYAGAALVYGDRYAVCEMLTQEFAAEVYDLKEGKVVGKLLHYGNGPQEVLVPIFNMFGDTLQVEDMLALNPYYFENDDMGIHNGEPLFFYTDGKKAPYDVSKVMSAGVVQGPVTVHPDNGNVVFANSVESDLFFLNKDLSVYRRITGPLHDKVDYTNVSGQLVFSGNSSDTYLAACSDREYVYLLYDGRHYNLYDDDQGGGYTDHDMHLFQMDWKGRLVGSYILKGVRYIAPRLSCGSQPGTVYVSAISPDEGNLQIFYYDLRKYN